MKTNFSLADINKQIMNKLLLIALSAVFIFTANVSAQLSATVNGNNPTCSNPGSATVVPSGGNGYTYKWSTGVTTATASGLTAGTYTVTVYSSGGTQWDTLFFETFDGAHNWTLNTSTGANGADPNFFTVSDNEGGVAPGGCGVANNGDGTLHVTSVFNPNGGAAYDAGGGCGFLYCPLTNTASSSPDINTAGVTNLVLRYDFIGNGQTTLDVASSLYSIDGGANYISLDATLRSINTGCAGQGRWTQRSYNLPTNAIGLTNFRVRFNWKNNDDGQGTDPSFAANNVLLRDSVPLPGDSVVKTVTLTAPSLPYFVTAALSVVNPSCGTNNGSINNVGVAGGTSPYNLIWTVNSAQIGTSNSISNIGAGTYIFTATDANGCDIDTSFTLVATTNGNPVTITTNRDTICAGDTTQICAPVNANVSYLWSTGETSTCIQATQAGNYYLTVTENGNCTALSNAIPIFVNTPPAVSVSVSGDTLTSANAVAYQWYLNGQPITNATNSVYVAMVSGNYAVEVTDDNGCKSTSNGIPVVINSIKNTVVAGMKLYPNPVNDELVIEGLNFAGKNSVLAELFDVAGRKVFENSLTHQISILDLSTVNAGVYILRIAGQAVRVVKQ